MKNLLACMAGLLAMAVPTTPASASISDLFVFGDSQVDSGNAQIGAAFYGLPDPAPAAQGYVGGRFSNGANFADYLSFSLFGTPSVPFLAGTGGTNFAVGGATAVSNPAIPPIPPGFQQELLAFAGSGMTIPSDALVLLAFGGNDVRDVIGTPGPIDFTPTVEAVADGIAALAGAGAQHVLVVGLPDIGLLPSTLIFGPDASSLATARSLALNSAFQSVVADARSLHGLDIGYFDMFGLEQGIRANPMAYGLPAGLDVSTPCLIGGAPTVPGGCEGFLYFDAIHPTTAVHEVAAGAILRQLAAVPEPRVWALLTVGFLLVGGLQRQRYRLA